MMIFRHRQGSFVEHTIMVLLKLLGWMGAIILILILGFMFYHGINTLNIDFLTKNPVDALTGGGIFSVLLGTIFLTILCMVIVVPVGVLTAVFLCEYTRNGFIINMVNMAIHTLAGVPSVVYGLFGLTVFVIIFNLGMSLLAGSLTLAVTVLPYMISTSVEAIKVVPQSFREASLACGATKWQTIKKAVLPVALPGIITGAVLSTARVAGETAPIMFTAAAFFAPGIPDSLLEPVMALPSHIYVLATAGTNIEQTRHIQYGTALVLIFIIFALNSLSIIVRYNYRRSKKW